METLRCFYTVKIRWLVTFILLSACVDKIDFEVPPAQSQIVIEGMISDEPGPYTVKVSTALALDADSSYRSPVVKAVIRLYDDQGNVEDLSEVSPGVYLTAGIIQGQVGHSYHIRVETEDGNIFESEPDLMNPVGEIETIRHEFEARTSKKSYGEVKADVFNIYVDANAGASGENFVRWRFTGTYQVLTYPELNLTESPSYTPYKNPYPCSGYIVVPFSPGGKIEQVADCTCCTCWVKHYEVVPQLSDEQLIANSEFRNIKVGEVPINQETFYEKYQVEVSQMSLSSKTFQFFKLIRAQKEGSSSLFQPPSGEIKGNVVAVNTNQAVIGIFWATSIKSKFLYLTQRDVPYLLTPITYVTQPCYVYYPNASTAKPENWE